MSVNVSGKLAKRLLCCAAAGLLLCLSIVCAAAAPQKAPRTDLLCTLRLKLGTDAAEDDQSTALLYRVAEWKITGERVTWEIGAAYDGCAIPEPEDTVGASGKELAACVAQRAIAYDYRGTAKSGEIVFHKLPAGLYLVLQAKSDPQGRSFSPFLIALPHFEEQLKEGYASDVTASPKLGKEEPPPLREPKLPQTGQLWWPVPVLTGAGIVLLILARAARWKEKRR